MDESGNKVLKNQEKEGNEETRWTVGMMECRGRVWGIHEWERTDDRGG